MNQACAPSPIADDQKNAIADQKNAITDQKNAIADQNDAITDQKDAITDQNDRKNDIGDIDDSKLSRAVKSSVTIGQRIDDRSISPISPAIVDSVDSDKRLGAMIGRANISLQHPVGMIQIDGRWATPVTTSEGLPTGEYRWAGDDELPQTEDPQIGKSVSQATLQEVTLRTRAIMTKVALNPGNVLAHEWISRTMDPATERPMFEGDFGDFVNWCINYSMARGYGFRVGIITTGQGAYQQMRRSQAQPAAAQGGGLVIV